MKIKKFWNFRQNEPILGIKIGDVNNNGKLEIIAYSKYGTLLILSLNGTLLLRESISKNYPIWHARIYDIDADGKNELIFGGMDGILRIFKCDLTYHLEYLWNHQFNSSISGIIIDDINNDKIEEIIVFSLDKTIRVLNPITGTLLWGQVFEEGIADAIIFPESQNLTKKEIIACGNDGTIRSFDGIDGKLLWIKKFYDKIRCISYINSVKGVAILSGGDDKKLHIIDKKTQKELITKEFNDFVWISISYPNPIFNNAIISSYSFDYFNKSIPIENIKFISTIICLNEFLEIKWELEGFNLEVLKVIKIHEKNFIIAGTTMGELIIIEEETGRILFLKKNNSCINMIEFLIEKRLIISCHDNGNIFVYKLEDL